MPDGLPNNLYTGGAVAFNSTPYTQFYLQSQARKRAKDEALTNYFSNFTKSINPAGMRTKDIEEGWMQKRNDWEKYYYDNADKIKNPKLDNGKSYGEYMSRYQDILNDTQKSKNEVDARKQVMPIIADPEKRQRLTNSFLGNLHNSDYSIYDKRYVPLDVSSVDYNPKELDAKDLEGFKNSFWSGLKQSDSMPTVHIDPKTKSKFSSKTTDFNKDALAVATHNAETLYNTNSVFQHFIDNLDTPEHFDVYNKIFKEHYGHDLDMKHPEEMAAAYALSVKPSPVTETALQAYSPTTIKINTGGAGVNGMGIADNIINGWVTEAKGSDFSRTNLGLAKGKLALNVPMDIKKLFSSSTQQQLTNGTTKTVEKIPDLITITPDYKYFVPIDIYQNDKGETETVEGAPVSLQSVRQMVGDKYLSQKEWFNQQTNYPNPVTPEPSKKKKSKTSFGAGGLN